VGAQGAGVNKLRDQLGVKVDVSDDVDEKDKETTGKKKKVAHQKSKVKVSGVLVLVHCAGCSQHTLDHRQEGKRGGRQKEDLGANREARE
jgi:hypothetical protein